MQQPAIDMLDNSNLEMDPYQALACAVIRQAINDGIAYVNMRKNPPKDIYKLACMADDYSTAEKFIMGFGLEYFIKDMQLPLEPEYIRKKYQSIKRSLGQERSVYSRMNYD